MPIHGIFPLSRALEVVAQVEQFFSGRAEALAGAGIQYSFMAATEGAVWVFEPMFYWPDEIGPIHKRYLDAKRLERFGGAAPNPAARELVGRTRRELRDLYFELGAVHGQIGKYYDYRGAVSSEVFETLTLLKRALDPECRLNPGNFGWRRDDRGR